MIYKYQMLFTCIMLSVIICLGCTETKKVDEEILVGKYCFNIRDNKDSLFLLDETNYYHKFYTQRGKVFEAKGEWSYDSLTNRITFEDFIFFNEEGADNPPGIWHSTVEITKEGEVRLMYAPEHKVFYYKR